VGAVGRLFEKSKGKSMKFIWRYIRNKLRDISDEPELARAMNSKYSTVSVSEDSHWGDGLNIRVHAALGGKIVSFARYDRKSDRNANSVYVIPDDHEFERELGKLITLESMRG
jgi:hypothetical protein